MKIVDGYLDAAHQMASPNCDTRPSDEISLIVIHCISLPEGHYGNHFVERLFCNELTGDEHKDFVELPELKVSSHLFIRRNGDLVQFVPFQRRAWHAGSSCYQGKQACNDFSIGIELEGTDQDGYADKQYEILEEICFIMQSRWSIGLEAIVGHSDIAPGRKSDPGSGFDWQRLRSGLKARLLSKV